jgi:hypothetical protein
LESTDLARSRTSLDVEVEVLSLRVGPLLVDGLARYLDWDLYFSR